MNAQQLYQAGRLDEAIQELGTELRSDPTDVRSRTFLFELLCFAGEYDRAEKQLDVIAGSSKEAGMGALLYRSALHAERLRKEKFEVPLPAEGGPEATISGTLNGEPFTSISDVDPRIGARLEVFAAGQYTWVPFAQIAELRIEEPKRLRDLLWAPGRLKAGPDFQDFEFGEVLIPAIAPASWRHEDDEVRLGRVLEWDVQEDGSEVPVGAKLLLVDDEPIPVLDVRELVFDLSDADG